jgi:LacI family transcriptional regulator
MNIKDLAAKAGVSISTVSLVLNERPGVKKETRTKVLELAKKYKYVPNHIARSLVMKKTRTIGIVVPDISEVFYGTLVKIMQDAMSLRGYSMMLCNTENDLEKESHYLNFLLEKGTDGIIMVPCAGAEQAKIQSVRIPVVFVDRYIPGVDTSYVGINNRNAGREATAHLIRLGHRKVACIAGPKCANSSEERIQGYRDALESNGISCRDDYVLNTDWTVSGGFSAARTLLDLPEPPSAIFTTGDTCAIGVFEALSAEQVKVPEEMALVGFDDMKFAPFLRVPLTSVRQPLEKMGNTAVELLLDKLGDGNKSVQKIFDTELIIRESCGYALRRYR